MEIKNFLYSLLSGFFGDGFTVEVEQQHWDYSITVINDFTGEKRHCNIDALELSKMYTEEGSMALGNCMKTLWLHFYSY